MEMRQVILWLMIGHIAGVWTCIAIDYIMHRRDKNK
jgi:hypothetical protein